MYPHWTVELTLPLTSVHTGSVCSSLGKTSRPVAEHIEFCPLGTERGNWVPPPPAVCGNTQCRPRLPRASVLQKRNRCRLVRNRGVCLPDAGLELPRFGIISEMLWGTSAFPGPNPGHLTRTQRGLEEPLSCVLALAPLWLLELSRVRASAIYILARRRSH